MRINRIALGVLTIPIAAVVGLVLAYLEAAVLGLIHPFVIGTLALAAAGIVFKLAEKLGVLDERPRVLSLSDEDPVARSPIEDGRPIEPR